ncbi:uncharacterized protein METZ01_LOCUS517546, partial [marine metagenome]
MFDSSSTPSPPSKRRRLPKPVWAGWNDDKLLDVRICDLAVSIKGTPLERRIVEVNQELAERGINFRAHFWLADDWFTPDGV